MAAFATVALPAASVQAVARPVSHVLPLPAKPSKASRPQLPRRQFMADPLASPRLARPVHSAARSFTVSAAFDGAVGEAAPKKKRGGSPGPKNFHGRTSMDNVLCDTHDAVFDIDLSLLEREDAEHGNLFVVKVRCPDRAGLLKDLLGTLRDFDYVVFNGLIRSDSETQRVKDNFYIRRSECPEHAFSGDQMIRLYNALLSILRNDGFYRPAESVLSQVAIEDFDCWNGPWRGAADIAWNVIELRCPDRDYLLFEVTHALNEAGYHVNSAEVSTDWGGQVFDRIVVGTSVKGGKLDALQQAEVVDIMKSTLCKLEIMRRAKASKREAEKARRAALLGLAKNATK
eukprot:tig00000113_g5639.t1